MKKLLPLSLLAALLSGCVIYDPSVPEGYVGPLATVKDTAKRYSYTKADAFYLTTIDGRTVVNSRAGLEDGQYSYGKPADSLLVVRNIPAKESTVTIVGRTIYGAPIATIFGTVYQVTGEVVFEPEKDKTYLVKGQLGENYSAVWIEEEISHDIVTERVEIRGSAVLGISEK